MFIRFIYNFLLFLLLPFAIYKLFFSKKYFNFNDLKEYFGIGKKTTSSIDIWIHAVSVGEVILAIDLIKKVKKINPDLTILVTTTTKTGKDHLLKNISDLIEHRFAPFDLFFAVKMFLNFYQPKELWLIETELWFNWLNQCKKKNIPVKLINARLSKRSTKNYKKFTFATKNLMAKLDLVLAQNNNDALNFIECGVNQDKVKITGSLKFDINLKRENYPTKENIVGNRPVWIGASTHQGEDEILIQAHQKILQKIPNCLLILVPRHPERFDVVSNLCSESNLKYLKRSSNKKIANKHQIYLIDSMGELLDFYAISDIAFIGGSLVPVGGHNYLEAVAFKKPCLSGKYDFNFKFISKELQKVNALKICNNLDEIILNVCLLIQDQELRESLGKLGYQILKENHGASQKTLNYLIN